MHIPERFLRAVSTHVVKNIIDIDNWQAPLILGIHGPVGEGKTAMCETVLQMLGIKSFLISGGQLESEDAGKPAELVRETYIEASNTILTGKALMSVVLINDFDTGLGDWGKIVQFTVNTQQIFAELMHLTDYPEIVDGKQTLRVPIIITGNNFSSLHRPLTRTGRMSLFEWIPTSEERVKMVQKLFPLLTPAQISELVLHRFKDRPISFFSHLKSSLFDDQLWSLVDKQKPENIIRYIRKNNGIEAINYEVLRDFNYILTIGEQLNKKTYLTNHIKNS